MSLSPHERRQLDCISAGLTMSDPVLAEFLGEFTRLTTSEVMPTHEVIEARRRHLLGTAGPARRPRSRCPRGRPARLFCRAAIITLVLIPLVALVVAVAVFLSTSSLTPCRASQSVGCTKRAPSAAPQAGPS